MIIIFCGEEMQQLCGAGIDVKVSFDTEKI
jgi:hypothetical protein